MTDQTAPHAAVWIDGDPLMEAIASAVWEQCRTDYPSSVVDDPRNIAAVAAAVARAHQPAGQAPATDRAACPDPIECGHEAALGQAREETRRLGLMVDEYGAGASALTDKLRRVRDMHRETCPVAQGVILPPAASCSLCGVLDAPAMSVLGTLDPVEAARAGQHYEPFDEATAEHHTVDGALYLCHAGDHYCPQQPVVEARQASPPSEDCTCIPFTRQGGVQRFCQPGDTVDMISGWEIGGDCPHHRDAAKAQQPKEARPRCTCNYIAEPWIKMDHAPDCPARPVTPMDPVNILGIGADEEPTS